MITERVEEGAYACKEAFIADFKRMVENCAFYNGLESEIATKGYRLWVVMLDALHTVCFDNDEEKKGSQSPKVSQSRRSSSSSSRDRDVTSGAGAACSPASRLYVPEHARKPRPNGSGQRVDERTMVKTRRASRTATRRKSSPPRVRENVSEGDDVDDEDFAEPRVKRNRRGRPPKATRTRAGRRTTSKATSRTRPVVKSPALEALSRATRKALEDSADLTYDICRLSGDFEANSEVAGYFPDLNIAGTHSHPTDLLARFGGSPENSGGYTIVESPEATSQCGTNVEGNGQGDEPRNDTANGEEGRKGLDGCDDESNSDTDRSRDSSAPSANAIHEAEDTDTTSSDESLAEGLVRVQEGTVAESGISGIGSKAELDHRATDTSIEGAKGGATQETAPPPSAIPLGTIATSSPFTSHKRQDAYFQTSLAMPPRCRSVPPLHFVPVNVRHATRDPCSSGSSGPDDSDSNATASAEPAEEVLRSATSLKRGEEGTGLVESGEHIACEATTEPDEESERRETSTSRSDGDIETTKESDSDILCQVLDECSDSTAGSNHASASEDTEAKDKTPGMLSEGSEGAVSEAVDSQKTTQEQAGASIPAGNVSPGRIQARERWITKLQGDLHGAEQEFYCTLDSPKSSFSFSSGYLSEDALSPSMRYHNSSSPLPQLSPSRLSPLLPTSCQPPQKETPPVMDAEATQPSSGQAAVDADKAPPTDAASTRQCSSPDQPLPPEPMTQPPSPPFGAPTPLQKISALVADIPSSTNAYDGAGFPSPLAPPTTSASVTCGGSDDHRRDGRDGTAFRPTYSNAGHTTAGLRLTSSSSYIARPVPTQPHPTGVQKPPCTQEPIAYFIPAGGGHFQPVPIQQVARPSVEGGAGTAAVYDWPGGMGAPLQWGLPRIIYYPAELAGHAPQALFLPDLSPEAQRNALTSAPWLRKHRTPDYNTHLHQFQPAAHVSHYTSGVRTANCVTVTTTPTSATQTSSPAQKARTLVARSAASMTWHQQQQQQQQHRAYATHYQMAQPLMVTSAGQLHPLAEALYRQQR
ncbi:uncharacterized protein LOC119381955 [Rhipicephalus sanguineus]|uniref:uncharacterized protein LOC119381955 n=1 Tax=Rhipicephalus sanguineus TaxID=34632 RepID=UPI0020C3DD35|nr:uncharacterized protein LOC119381955 [Rhipicephalus sanguineus]